jgi:hypothetical protein
MKARTTLLCGIAVAVIGATPAVAGAAPGARAGGRNLPAPLAPSGSLSAIEGTTQLGSYNWSGYAQAAAAGTFHAVTDTWKVPIVNTSPPGNQFSSDWVGIGGLNDGTLVQAGTEADNLGGTALYRAWTEILPEPENPLSLTVSPGDKITTTVQETTPGVWKMTVADKTTKKTASRTTAYGGSSQASVESIHERPCIMAPCNAVEDLASLASTTNVTFDPGKYGTVVKAAPKTPLMNLAAGATLDQIFMLNNAGSEVIAAPSVPDADTAGPDGFTVADGSVSPAPPKS